MSKQNILFIFSLVAIVWLSAALIRVENQRYALSVGMCIDPVHRMADHSCLASVETRTGWWWHLYYALTDA